MTRELRRYKPSALSPFPVFFIQNFIHIATVIDSYIFHPTKFPNECSKEPRFFFKLDGVLLNFTTEAAKRLDDLHIPISENGIFEEDMLSRRFAPDMLYDICSGRGFWESVEPYAWTWMYFEKAFATSRAKNVFFITRGFESDAESWGGKAAWVHRNFGSYGINHLIMSTSIDNFVMLCCCEMDILVTALKYEADVWCKAGGTALYFPELDIRHANTATEIAKRLNAISDSVRSVRENQKKNSSARS